MRFWLALSLFACVAMTSLVGCSSTSVPLDVIHAGETGGVKYEVQGQGQAKESRSANGDIAVTLGKNQLEIKGLRVIANGKDSGLVRAGDRVFLDRYGQIHISHENP